MAKESTWGKAKEALQAVASIKNFHETIRGFWGIFVWATICDGFSSIPWAGMIFSGLGYGSIWMYLEMKGVSASPIGSSKRMAATAAEWIAGAFGLGVVPGISVWTYFAIAEHKVELTEQQREKQVAVAKAVEKAQRNNKIAGEIKPVEEVEERQETSTYWKGNKAA